MTSESHKRVEITDDALVIRNLRAEGSSFEVACEATSRGEPLEPVVRRMLDLGGHLLQQGAANATVDAVGTEVNRLIEAVVKATAEHLPETLGAELAAFSAKLGERIDPSRTDSVQRQLAEIVRSGADQHREQITRTLLDEGGPLAVLKADVTGPVSMLAARQDELLKQVTALSERLVNADAVTDERERGPGKGVAYESLVGTILDWTFAPHEDTVEDVGTELGGDGNKCGDHTVTVNPAATGGREARVVFESKCRSLGIRAALNELDRAMSNRDAEAGVLVFASSEIAPIKGRSLRAYSGNRLICVLDREQLERLPLEVAGQMARSLAIAAVAAPSEGLDTTELSDSVAEITKIVDDAKAIKRGSGAARRGLDQVETAYEKLRSEALDVASRMAERLQLG